MNKKFFTLLLAGLMTVSSTAVLAEEATSNEEDIMLIAEEGIEAISEEDAAPLVTPSHVQFAGKVTAVTDDEITIMNEAEEIILKTVNVQLTLTNDGKAAEVKVDDEITAFVDANAPAPLVLPATYSPAVIIVNTEAESSVDVSVYTKTEEEGAYINALNNLVINVSEETDIANVKIKGEKFEGEIDGRALVVFYTMTTRSIPAQTAPVKVYVLDEAAEVEEVEEVEETEAVIDIAAVKNITVNGKAIEGAPVEGMLPIRAIAEGLGFDVAWDNTLRAVTVGNAYTFKINENSYVKGKMMPMELSSAPVIVNNLTYVPVEFFTEVLEAEASQEAEVLDFSYTSAE